MTRQESADLLGVSLLRFNAIAEAFGIPYDATNIAEALIEELGVIATYMADHGIADPAIAIAQFRTHQQAASIPETFGVQANHSADMELVQKDALNRYVGYQVASNIAFGMAIVNGVDPDCLTPEQKKAIEDSEQFAQNMVNQRLGGSQTFLSQLATGARTLKISAVAVEPLQPSLVSAPQN